MLVKIFILLIFILNLTDRVHAADFDNDLLFRWAIQESLSSRTAPDFDDDPDLWAGIEASLKENKEQALQKALQFPLFQYVNTLLTQKDSSSSIENLFMKPNFQKWQQVYKDLKNNDPVTGLSVVLLLNDLKQACPKDIDIGQQIEGLADQALVQLFSGCWGISNTRVAPDMENRLKDILRDVGKSFAKKEPNYTRFNKRVFEAFGTNKALPKRYADHFFIVFQTLSEGYGEIQPSHLPSLINDSQKDFVKLGIEGRQVTSFFSKAGYYPPTGPITLTNLVETARFKDPKISVNGTTIKQLETYLKDFDPDSPSITANLENLKTLWRLLQAQPVFNTNSSQALENLLFRGILEKSQKIQGILLLLTESLKSTDFKGKPDPAYEKALKDKKVTPHQPRENSVKVLNDGIYNWLFQYIMAINNDNQITKKKYVIRYPGLLMWRQVQVGEEITDQEFGWIASNPDRSGTIAGADEESVPTGRVKKALYVTTNQDGSVHVSNCSRAIDYLISQGKIDSSLKLPILLMLNNSMLD